MLFIHVSWFLLPVPHSAICNDTCQVQPAITTATARLLPQATGFLEASWIHPTGMIDIQLLVVKKPRLHISE